MWASLPLRAERLQGVEDSGLRKRQARLILQRKVCRHLATVGRQADKEIFRLSREISQRKHHSTSPAFESGNGGKWL